MTLTDEITGMLYCALDKYDSILIPRCKVWQWELDLFRETKDGMVTEFEIKVSYADFLNDFKKGALYCGEIRNKHDVIAKGESFINKFYFVCPTDVLPKKDIPAHAGLIYYNVDKLEFTVEKEADIIHAIPAPPDIYRVLAFISSRREFELRKQRDKIIFSNNSYYKKPEPKFLEHVSGKKGWLAEPNPKRKTAKGIYEETTYEDIVKFMCEYNKKKQERYDLEKGSDRKVHRSGWKHYPVPKTQSEFDNFGKY
jgi:hypothetical protein